ncbi:MAG: cell surface protein SprA [Gemmatimonadota bacterium]
MPSSSSAQDVRVAGDTVRLPRLLHPALGEAPQGPRLGLATLETPFVVTVPAVPGWTRPDLWPRFADWATAWRRLAEARLPQPRVPRLGDGPRAGERMARAGGAAPVSVPDAGARGAAVAPDSAADAAADTAAARAAAAARRAQREADVDDRANEDSRRAGRRDGDVEVDQPPAPPPIGARPAPQTPGPTVAPGDTLPGDSVVYLVREPVIEADTTSVGPQLPGALGELRNLGIRLRGRTDMKGEWNKIEPCNIFVALKCESGLVPRLSPDVQFQLQVGGTISERVHVDVDFDQAREFDATNNINVFYQGFEDEVLRRVEVGDVNLRLPRSRYMTQGVPAGNFGFKAEGQLGPIDFQAVWAQQKGDITEREFVFGGGGTGDDVVLDQTVVWDDETFLSGLFFYLVPPDSLAGAPHVDALALQPLDVPAVVRPSGAFGIQVYRAEGAGNLTAAQQADQNLFRALAVAGEGADRVEHAGLFRQLEPTEDFEIHSSGLWIVLRSRLTAAEALAIAYVTETGDTIGTLNAETVSAQGTTPELLLLRGPEDIHQPGRPTWRQEMHNVYRVDSSNEVERGSVALTISLGEESAGATFITTNDGTRATYLRFFGLDEDNPVDEVDEAQLFRPQELFGQDAKVSGVFVMFPTLEPFARPGPVVSLGLGADDAASLLGQNANLVIYDDPDPIDRANGSRFRLNFTYRVRSAGGTKSSFNLGAIGIREGSERIFVGSQRLIAGEDYTIDYEVGTLNLVNPDAIFGGSPNAQLRATWEQQPLFQIAPKSVFGMNARYQAGQLGQINVLGIFQSERSLVNRPQLGLEAGALFVGGVTGDLDLPSSFLDRAMGAIPGLRTAGRSAIRLTGEVAMSTPNPNSQGDTFLDDFEATNEALLSTISNSWRWGSAPSWTPGAGTFLPTSLGTDNAGSLTWQSQILDPATGQVGGRIRSVDIDRSLNVIGTDTGEPAMFMVITDTLPFGQRSWRSITTVLSTSGRDLTQSEFLEFYVRRDDGVDFAFIWDIGTVSEDAFVFDGLGNLSGAYPDGEPWGQGILDQEAELGFAVWGDSLDARGLWNQECEGDRQSVFAIGSLGANCTRGNGLNDSEDLDGNGALLSSDGAHFRFTVPLGEESPFLVRDRSQTGTNFELYRVPLRAGLAEAVGGANESTWRFIRHVRLTVSVDDPNQSAPVITLARPKLLGGRWPKREGHGLIDGLTGAGEGASSGSAAVSVAPVSRVNEPAYVSPPNTSDRAQDVTAGVGTSRQEINEKGLRLTYQDVGPGERGEVFFRYLNRPRDLLEYQRVRMWALPRAGNFGDGGDQSLLIKFGTDGSNYYLRRTRLSEPVTSDALGRGDWVDVPMDFQEWKDLRVMAEDSLIRRVAPPDPNGPIVVGSGDIVPDPGTAAGDGRIEIWNADSTYAVVLQDRARAPNLASIRELSLAVFNGGDFPSSGEVWFNELRLDQPDTRSGVATDVNLAINAADFMSANVSFSSESERFQRGLDSRPDFEADRTLSVNSRMQLGNFAPSSWGLDLPVQVAHARTDTDPFFLNRSDITARGLEGLREIGSRTTNVGVSLRKATPTANPWVSAVVDGLSLNANWRSSESSASTTRSEASGFTAGAGYNRRPGAREFDPTPTFLEDALRWVLPGFVERSTIFRNFTEARFRWSPSALTLQTTFQDTEARTFRFDKILELPDDTLFAPTSSPARSLRSQARIGLQPFRSMDATFAITSNRDLLEPFLATQSGAVQAALEQERGEFLGLGVGWERNRSMSTGFNFNPELFEWLRPGLSWNTQYSADRNPSFVAFEVQDEDSVARLQRQFRGQRALGRQFSFSPSVLGAVLLGTAGEDAGLLRRGLVGLISRLDDIDLRWQDGLSSQFDRNLASPEVGYQFGFGDLEDFRTVGGSVARTVRETGSFSVDGGFDLPLGSALSVGYQTGDSRALADRGGDQDTESRTWPDVNWRWSRVPVPGFLRGKVGSMNLSAGFRVTERQNRFGSTTQSRTSEDTSVPLRFSMSLLNGMSVNYNGSLSEGVSKDPTGETQRRNDRHNVEMRGSLDAPEAWESFSQPIHATLGYRRDSQFSCRTRFAGQTEEADTCTATSDFVTQTLSVQLDTVLNRINLGANLSYTDRQSSTGIREGNRQVLFTLFGQFDFQFGRFPSAVGLRR